MFGSYKIYPLTADGDIYALYDAEGCQVAMGSREVCRTLLHLVTTSPLLGRPREADRAHLRRHTAPPPVPVNVDEDILDLPALSPVTISARPPRDSRDPARGRLSPAPELPADPRRPEAGRPAAVGVKPPDVARGGRLSVKPFAAPASSATPGFLTGDYTGNAPNSAFGYAGLFAALLAGFAALIGVVLLGL